VFRKILVGDDLRMRLLGLLLLALLTGQVAEGLRIARPPARCQQAHKHDGQPVSEPH